MQKQEEEGKTERGTREAEGEDGRRRDAPLIKQCSFTWHEGKNDFADVACPTELLCRKDCGQNGSLSHARMENAYKNNF